MIEETLPTLTKLGLFIGRANIKTDRARESDNTVLLVEIYCVIAIVLGGDTI
jgi:hypothetical protein